MTEELAAFLLTRIAEEEADAYRAVAEFRPGDGGGPSAAAHLQRWTPARVLAECDAKGQIVEALRDTLPSDQSPTCELVLQLLALPYADHPDHRPEWRP